MSPDALLGEKLPVYRSLFEQACRGLFDGGEGVTVELDEDDDDGIPILNAGSEPASPPATDRVGGTLVKQELLVALRDIADDFARAFNAKLEAAAKADASVALVAENYVMTSVHVDELAATLAVALQPLFDRLDVGDLDAARRATIDAWPLLERRIKSKWQAYFVFTFQDVSVERKAARDRRKLQPRFDVDPTAAPPGHDSARLSMMPDLAPPVDERAVAARSPWIAVVAVLILAAAGGWLLIRHSHAAAPAPTATGR